MRTLPSPLLVLPALLSAPLCAQSFDPPDAVDINPDPTIVEVNLTAGVTTWQYIPGVDTTVWAYNGTVPGPTIRANVGDTVLIHFKNELPDETTVHWHGIEVPARMDGSHISQFAIQPGDTFDYQFQVQRDALYWYHPHIRTFDQVEKGLYGAFLVRDPAKEQALGFDQLEEHIIVFDDVLLDANNQVVPAFDFAPGGGHPDPLANALYHVNGREGNVLLVNGREAGTVTLDVANGQPQRWRVVNAANTTFCRLDINDEETGFGTQLYEVGSDMGFDEKPFKRLNLTAFGPVGQPREGETPDHPTFSLLGHQGEGILAFPGERMDVIFTPNGQDGERFTITQNDWQRGRHVAVYGTGGTILLPDDQMDGFYPDQDYFDVVVHGAGGEAYVPPSVLTTYPPRPATTAPNLKAFMGHTPPDPDGNVILFAQADLSSGTPVPLPASKINAQNAQDVNIGDVRMWEIVNASHGDHPFHMHGFFFELLEYEYQDDTKSPDNLQYNFKWQPNRRIFKDTVRLPARGGLLGTSRTITRLLVHYDDTGRVGQTSSTGAVPLHLKDGGYEPGGWLFHCHILEHSGKGMLSLLEVHDVLHQFSNLGYWLTGQNGNADLSMETPVVVAGQPTVIDLVNGLPNTAVTLVASNLAAKHNFRGGVLVPNPTVLFAGVTDANGVASWSLGGLHLFPPGTHFFVQAGWMDPGGPNGWALSNALEFSYPGP